MLPFLKILFAGRARFLTLGVLAVVIVVLVGLVVKLKPPTFKPIHPSSMLKRIEYVEHLRLSTYYYEEIIALGTRRRVKKIADDQREKVEEAEKWMLYQSTLLVVKENKLDSLNKLIFSLDTALIQTKANFERARLYYEQMDRFVFEFPHIKRMLGVDSAYFGDSVRIAFLNWERLNDRFEAKPWMEVRKREGRNQMKAMLKDSLDFAEANLRMAVGREKEIRRNHMAFFLEKLNREESASKQKDRELKERLKKEEKSYGQIRDDYEKAGKDLEAKRQKLAEAEAELSKVLLAGQDSIKPELLIVVPAELSAYIDLRELRISSQILDDTVLVLLPPIHLDSVIIELDSTKSIFELGGRSITLRESAMYYEIYQQLKDAVIETEKRVKVKAIDAGIYEETSKLARQYIRDFASTLGYQVKFVDSFSMLSQKEQAERLDSLEMPDTNQSLFIDTLPQLEDSLLPELVDSLIVQH